MVLNEMCIVLIDNFEIAELNIPTQQSCATSSDTAVSAVSAVSAGTRRGSCRGHCGARRADQPWSTCPQQDHNPAPHPLGCIAWLVSWSWRVSMLPPRLPTSSPSNIHIVVRQSFAFYQPNTIFFSLSLIIFEGLTGLTPQQPLLKSCDCMICLMLKLLFSTLDISNIKSRGSS